MLTECHIYVCEGIFPCPTFIATRFLTSIKIEIKRIFLVSLFVSAVLYQVQYCVVLYCNVELWQLSYGLTSWPTAPRRIPLYVCKVIYQMVPLCFKLGFVASCFAQLD